MENTNFALIARMTKNSSIPRLESRAALTGLARGTVLFACCAHALAAAPVTPLRADQYVEQIGINTHFTYGNTRTIAALMRSRRSSPNLASGIVGITSIPPARRSKARRAIACSNSIRTWAFNSR